MLYHGSAYTRNYYGELTLAFTFTHVDAATVASLEASEQGYVVISWKARHDA